MDISCDSGVFTDYRHDSDRETDAGRKNDRMKCNVECVVLNFDNAYCGQNFYKGKACHWIDGTKVRGSNCYCDDEAKKKIRELIQPYPISGLHYIDSGNYHYVSELWLEKATEPFVLVVFDHHTDMQPSMFENLLSCGCWVKQVIDTNRFLKQVILIGAKEELIEQIPDDYREKVVCYSENTCTHGKMWQKYLDSYGEYPFYISIDKDVLSGKEAITNWDQGSMKAAELESALQHIMEHHRILGIDICGEYTEEDNIARMLQAEKMNDQINEALYEVVAAEESGMEQTGVIE